jgi:DNA invertase Pin-like site-specific DNA recombinase
MAEKKRVLVSYLRVSTRQQGRSGLGLEAQRAEVAEYASREGLRVVAEYVEVESGRKAARPELAKAISHCRASKGALVVANLSRLSRNVSFLSALMDAGLDFVALDLPGATRFTIHVMVAVAEQQARDASARTRESLAAAKRRGVLLGSSRPDHWRGREARRLTGARRGVQRAAELRTQEARQHNALAVAEALKLRDRGMSWMDIAAELNKRGLVTRRGNQWSKSSVFMAVRAAAGCAAVVSATAGALGQWSAALV